MYDNIKKLNDNDLNNNLEEENINNDLDNDNNNILCGSSQLPIWDNSLRPKF